MFRLMMIFYNLILPAGFLCFLPGLVWKLVFRPGYKATFGERFGGFSRERKRRWRGEAGGVWFHAVSVGETVIACSLIEKLLKVRPNLRVILSTTTTTGQELARKKAPEGVRVIFAPIDFIWVVRRFFRLLKVEKLVIFETEIWPNLLCAARKRGVKTLLVNARLSDHSSRGYRRFGFFFAPLLAKFDLIAAQSEKDAERFRSVSPAARVVNAGNLKFDQQIPPDLPPVDFSAYFGGGSHRVIIAASTHPNEEALVVAAFKSLAATRPDLRLVIAPRHAERAGEVAAVLRAENVSFAQRSRETSAATPVLAVLADTTGELVNLMKGSDLVIMGKSLAGQDEGHNLIEPALLAKPIVTGSVLRNFRFILQVLKDARAVATVERDRDLAPTLAGLLDFPEEAAAMGARAAAAIMAHSGAAKRVVELVLDA